MIQHLDSDVNHRIAFWNQMTELKYTPPPREPLTKSEMLEETLLQNAIREAGKATSIANLAKPLRTLRVRLT